MMKKEESEKRAKKNITQGRIIEGKKITWNW